MQHAAGSVMPRGHSRDGHSTRSARTMNGATQSPACHDSFASFPFRLSREGRTVAAFSEASTLGTELDRMGDSAGASFPATPAGRGIITLRRGLVADPSFLSWIQQSNAPQEQQTRPLPAHRDLILTVFGETGQPVTSHRLPQCCVCSPTAGIACLDGHGTAALEMLRLSYCPTEPDAAP